MRMKVILQFHVPFTLPYTLFCVSASLQYDVTSGVIAGIGHRRWYIARLRLLTAALDDGREYLVGGRFTIADICVYLVSKQTPRH